MSCTIIDDNINVFFSSLLALAHKHHLFILIAVQDLPTNQLLSIARRQNKGRSIQFKFNRRMLLCFFICLSVGFLLLHYYYYDYDFYYVWMQTGYSQAYVKQIEGRGVCVWKWHKSRLIEISWYLNRIRHFMDGLINNWIEQSIGIFLTFLIWMDFLLLECNRVHCVTILITVARVCTHISLAIIK